MASFTGGSAGQIELRIDILGPITERGAFSRGPSVRFTNGSGDLLEVRVSFYVGQEEAISSIVLAGRQELLGWASEVESLIAGEPDYSTAYFSISDPELELNVKRSEIDPDLLEEGDHPFAYDFIVRLEANLFDPPGASITWEGPALHFAPNKEKLLEFTRQLRADIEAFPFTQGEKTLADTVYEEAFGKLIQAVAEEEEGKPVEEEAIKESLSDVGRALFGYFDEVVRKQTGSESQPEPVRPGDDGATEQQEQNQEDEPASTPGA